jgi:hypothetical protein
MMENSAANGHVDAGEQRNIQRSENHQSNRIYSKKHNARVWKLRSPSDADSR